MCKWGPSWFRDAGGLAVFEISEIWCRIGFWFKVLVTIFEVLELALYLNLIYMYGDFLGSERVTWLAIFEIFEIMCRFEFEISVSVDPLGSERVAMLAIFEISEITCRFE